MPSDVPARKRFADGSAARRLLLLAMLPSAAAACLAEPADPALGRVADPIVGGTPETGYPGAGALVLDYGAAFGHFCTGTLIADRWVLTAAHCLADDRIEPYMTSFFVGADARSRAGGTTYEIESFHPHPSYSPRTTDNDIALVFLRDRAAGVTTYAYNTTALDRSYVGRSITWIGYGVNDAAADTGGGLKRRGTGRVAEIRATRIAYGFSGAMPCRGDSGGPEFMTIGGVERVAGVISVGDENCSSYGIDTRVDPYASWIASTMAAGGGWRNCPIDGGGCGTQACWPVDEGVYDCLPSAGLGLGAECDPRPADRLPCRDGLACVRSWSPSRGACTRLCTTDEHCGPDYFCDAPFTDVTPEVGICRCRDRDGDGWCGSEECDDADPAVHPAAPEACGDGIDNDCDGAADEDCCVDADRDGHCVPADCDDANAAVNPAAAEACGNGIDDNCRDGVDEGCTCEDPDGDGWCPPDDCDDANPEINPGAREICRNGIDDNCRDGVDEGCACEDPDGDGWCPPDDCDDADPAVHPAALEACGDWIDNDCDGLADGDDPDCAPPTDGCGCAAPGRPGGMLPAAILLAAGLFRRRGRGRGRGMTSTAIAAE